MHRVPFSLTQFEIMYRGSPYSPLRFLTALSSRGPLGHYFCSAFLNLLKKEGLKRSFMTDIYTEENVIKMYIEQEHGELTNCIDLFDFGNSVLQI